MLVAQRLNFSRIFASVLVEPTPPELAGQRVGSSSLSVEGVSVG